MTSFGVAYDGDGNLYIADRVHSAIRKVAADGTITTVAGDGSCCFGGDGGPATEAQLRGPEGVAVDSSGNLYIADSSNARIRKVTASTGVITTVAGGGSGGLGDGGAATSATLSRPVAVAVDGSGNLYIADDFANRIRKVTVSTGIITTVAGGGTGGLGDGGAATAARLNAPKDVALDASSNIYIADRSNDRVRKVTVSTGIITTFAGSGASLGDGGPATSAGLSQPLGVDFDSDGNLYIADQLNNRIRKVDTGGTITTYAGNGSCCGTGEGGPATSAALSFPVAVAVDLDSDDDLALVDSTGQLVHEVDAATSIITTVAGNNFATFSGDGGSALVAGISSPNDVATDGAGNLYLSDYDHNRVRKVSSSGTITTVAGNGDYDYTGDGGPGTAATLDSPEGVAADGAGNLYIADTGNDVIRKVNSSGTITTVAGTGTGGYSGDGGPATSAQLSDPMAVAADASGNLYIADTGNDVIRKVSSTGTITTVAGTGTYGYSGDGGPATSATLAAPQDVAVGIAGTLFVADTDNAVVRRISSSGTIDTYAGNGSWGYSGDGGVATSAALGDVVAVALDGGGDLFISDMGNQVVRMVTPLGVIDTVAGTGNWGYSGDGGPATSADLSDPSGVAVDRGGNLFIADQGLSHIRRVEDAGSLIPERLFGNRRSSAYASDPVNTATGNFTETDTDLAFPAAVYGLDFIRTYNSLDDSDGPLGVGWTHRFMASVDEQSSGHVSFTDADGRVVTFLADGAGGYDRPEEVFGDLVEVSPGIFRIDWLNGQTWTFDAAGRLHTLTNWDGEDVTLTWSGTGLLTTATSSAGYDLTFTHSPAGRLIEVEASDGRVVSYTYTASAALETVTDPEGGVTTYDSDGAERITEITDPEGRLVIANSYDSTGRVASQTTPSGDTVTFAYDDDPVTTSVTSIATATTVVYQRDEAGRVVSVTDPDSEVLTKSYDAAGNLTAVVDRLGAGRTHTYDGDGNVLTVEDPVTGTTTLAYDSSDRVTSITDDASEVTTFTYDGTERLPATVTDAEAGVTTYTVVDGLVTSVTDADGVTTTFAYSTARNLTTVTDDLSNVTTHTYDAAGRRLTTTTPEANVTTWTYDDAGRVLTVTDAEGGVTTNTYDDAGLLLTTTDALGKVETRTYDTAGLLATVTSPEGNVTTHAYDDAGQLESVTDPEGKTTTYTYGPLGRVETVTDPLGRETSYGYDANGNQTSITDPTTATSTTTYNTAGQVTARTDALAHATTYTYDALGRLDTVTDPEGGVTDYDYDAVGRRTSVTDPEGGVTTTAYTDAGRVDTITNPEGEVTNNAYDLAGRLDTVTRPGGGISDYAYDDDGRVTSVTSPEGNVSATTYDGVGRILAETNPAGGVTTRAWSDRGELLTETDPTGGIKTFAYDDDGNLVIATDANGAATTYTYDGNGRRITTTNAASKVENFVYDDAGQLVTHTDPLGRPTLYTYDGAGRLATLVDPSGRTTTNTYDAAGRLTNRAHSGTGGAASTSFAYDDANRRTSMTDATGTTTYTYDAAGRLTGSTLPGGATLAYAYDLAGRRTSLTYPGGATATSTYDTAGRLDTLVHSVAGTTSYDWDDDGQLTSETLPSTATRTYTYDDGWRDSFAQTIPGATFTTTMARDLAGRVTSETTGTATTAYDYDDAGQLTTVTPPTGPATTYTYDHLGRRATKSDGTLTGTLTYTYDDASQLRSALPIIGLPILYDYDRAGRRTREVGTSGSALYDYDAAGRLTKFSRATTAGVSAQHRAYNGDGQLVAVENLSPSSLPGSATATTALTWDNAQPVSEVVQMAGPGGTTSLVAGPEWVAAVSGAATSEIAVDAEGSVVPTAGTGALARAGDYGAFGEPVGGATSFDVRLGYRGEVNVGDLVHLRARDYDPTTSAMTSTDPLDGVAGYPAVANTYHYAYNDPLNQVDPLGLRPVNDRDLRLDVDLINHRRPMGPIGPCPPSPIPVPGSSGQPGPGLSGPFAYHPDYGPRPNWCSSARIDEGDPAYHGPIKWKTLEFSPEKYKSATLTPTCKEWGFICIPGFYENYYTDRDETRIGREDWLGLRLYYIVEAVRTFKYQTFLTTTPKKNVKPFKPTIIGGKDNFSGSTVRNHGPMWIYDVLEDPCYSTPCFVGLGNDGFVEDSGG